MPNEYPEGNQINKQKRASWKQKLILESIYQTIRYPDLQIRKTLSKELGMDIRKIQIWFQNRRTKEKLKKKEGKFDPVIDSNDIDSQNERGNTLLIIASHFGLPVVKDLIQKGAKVNLGNHEDWRPLMAAICGNHMSTVQILLSCPDIEVNCQEKVNGQSPLHLASLIPNPQMVQMLLNSKDILVEILDFEKRTPLHHASITGSTESLKSLLAHCMDINHQTLKGFTLLHGAVFHDIEIVELLLERGAELTLKDYQGYIPLSLAVREEKIEIVSKLLEKEYHDQLSSRTEDGLTPFLISCCKGNIDIMKLLLEKGANPQDLNKQKMNGLHLAALNGSRQATEFLIQKGLSPKEKDIFMKTPLDYARIFKHPIVESLLLNYEKN